MSCIKMRIDIITTHPKMFTGAFNTQYHKELRIKIVKIKIHDLRNFSNKKVNQLTTINTEEELEW